MPAARTTTTRHPPGLGSAWARANALRFVDELAAFVAIPSVSVPGHERPVRRWAAWLTGQLRRTGLAYVRLLAGARHPVVGAASRRDPARPTVLVYGHYDVEPADPRAAWHSNPFRPVVFGGHLVGRGASDDKGPVLALVKALESWLRGSGELPVNVVVLVEGEEELGSPGLARLLETHARLLEADVAGMSDTRMLGPDRPAIAYAERGSLDLELEVAGPGVDLHSGTFAGAVHNPMQALAEILASLHDRDGRVAVARFYDDVAPVGPAERSYLERTGPSDEAILRDAHAAAPWGEPGYSLYERTTTRPAVTVNGIRGGYQGPGGKSIIPATAAAKLNVRLVPEQDPDRVEALLRAHLRRVTPPTVRARLHRRPGGARPILLDRAHSAMQAVAAAYAKGFGAPAVFVRSGGTIPVLPLLADALGTRTVLMGFALRGDRMHAPNERFRVASLCRGIETAIWFLAEVGRRRRPRAARVTDTDAERVP